MNIAIIDDIREDSALLCGYVEYYCAKNQIIANIRCFDSERIFIENFLAHFYDIIFLDICINKMKGLRIAKKYGKPTTTVSLFFRLAAHKKSIFLRGTRYPP